MNHLHHSTTNSNSVTTATATAAAFEAAATFTPLRLDMDKLFSDFDDGKKGWLSLQDVQAATLALCGFWPHRDQVIGFCRSKPTDHSQQQQQQQQQQYHNNNIGQPETQQTQVEPGRVNELSTPPTSTTMTSNSLAYFRLKQSGQLQRWFVEAGRIADIHNRTNSSSSSRRSSSQSSTAQLPPPLNCQLQSSDSTTSKSLHSTHTDTAVATVSQLPVAVGRFSWEEIFDALDTNCDGVIDYTDLSAVMTTVNDGPCSLAYARIPSLQELSGCLMDMIMDTRPTASLGSRHSETDSLTRRQFLSIMKGRA